MSIIAKKLNCATDLHNKKEAGKKLIVYQLPIRKSEL
jgi:hypothetical protein